MKTPKEKLQSILYVVGDLFSSWLAKEPSRELLQLAYARLGDIRGKIKRRLEAK